MISTTHAVFPEPALPVRTLSVAVLSNRDSSVSAAAFGTSVPWMSFRRAEIR